jgi:hypothetical protein
MAITTIKTINQPDDFLTIPLSSFYFPECSSWELIFQKRGLLGEPPGAHRLNS